MTLEDKIPRKDKEIKECIWYVHYKNKDVMSEIMMEIYQCHKCNGKEIKCKGYSVPNRPPYT